MANMNIKSPTNITKLFKPREYYVSFTSEGENIVQGVKVTITSEMITDLDRKIRIDLSSDPLYSALCKYVRNNPPEDRG